jgi:general secretion pathway protein H
MPVTSATGNAGFTLLELIVVLAIIVLLAAAWPFAAPRLFPTQQLRNEAQRLIASLRLARTAARVSGAPQIIEITDGGASYRAGLETYELQRGVIVRARGRSAERSPSILFYPDGSSSGGVLDLQLPDRTLSVDLKKLTGRASLLE